MVKTTSGRVQTLTDSWYSTHFLSFILWWTEAGINPPANEITALWGEVKAELRSDYCVFTHTPRVRDDVTDLRVFRQFCCGVSRTYGRSLCERFRVTVRAQARALAARAPAVGVYRRPPERAGGAAGESCSSAGPVSPTARVCVFLLSGLHERNPPDLLRVSEPDEPELRRRHPGAGRRLTVTNKHRLYRQQRADLFT